MTAQFCVLRGELWRWGFLLIAVWLERSQTVTVLPLLRVKYSVHEPARQHREQRLFSFSVGRLNHLRIKSPP